MSKDNKKRKFATDALHAGIVPDPSTGAIMTPIYQTSTFAQSAPGKHLGYEYARGKNPTREVLQNNLAALELGTVGLCFASGLAAIDAVLKLLKPGDEVISTRDLYGGSYRLFTGIFAKFGITFHFVDMGNIQEVSAHINEDTRLIWVETPTNPSMKIIDIEAIAKLTRQKNILLAVDNTFSSPALQQPLSLGADIVMHSLTKYIAGHSDVIMGALICRDEALGKELAYIQNASGAVPGPQDCFLSLRGIKTLAVRMKQHCENGRKIAHFLRSHPKVKQTNWPGFEDHCGFEIAKRQMKDFGGMVSFSLHEDTQEAAFRILEKFEVFSLAESLGGVESLAGHPATMTHAAIPRKDRLDMGLTDSMIRLSVGIEDIDDLIADLQQALT
ncbi:MAG: PLP-dependent aspartate aminotransferase family protein [Cyclobacteriaceae bacterium]|nr:PLP-dependent transferase [Cyclobacteriaceae bacterium]MCH8517132.1 PLP-dependent aspartate aminotransferase family protein [Cyclobacteriaceae bacterium]